MSRSDGNTANSGRQVENEADVLSAIELLLAERELGESLLVFNPDTYNTTESLIEFFTNDVLAIVGPHGGGLMNHRFAGPNVLVLEFLPTSRIEWINWEEVSVLNQTYAAIITEPIPDTKDDMIIEPSQVVDLLSRHIGTPGRMAGVSYDWDQE
jgi:capsular polysaccharide biosynthesis protein